MALRGTLFKPDFGDRSLRLEKTSRCGNQRYDFANRIATNIALLTLVVPVSETLSLRPLPKCETKQGLACPSFAAGRKMGARVPSDQLAKA